PRNYSVDRRRLRDLSAESVALTGYRLDELWRTPVVTKLHAKLANVAINDIALDLELAAPDDREQLLAAQDFPRVCCEQVQEGLLDRRERKILATDPDALLDQNDLEGAEADLRDQRRAHVAGEEHARSFRCHCATAPRPVEGSHPGGLRGRFPHVMSHRHEGRSYRSDCGTNLNE